MDNKSFDLAAKGVEMDRRLCLRDKATAPLSLTASRYLCFRAFYRWA